ncbi:uncharacterized protein [Nicotiana sylvestris]|uniref:Zinc finger MYM-type protein 1-like n=1 Tax=Nicotiana sylvestris TaxID=4096 RepID=A0A1U7YFC9_NICSY|nr:PREDICTED: zinc finger MYM-type protein 1-like [Nicotiana sylvestris]
MRQFSSGWFKCSYSRWLEYSVKKDAAFCLCCYLFKNDYVHGSTGDSFTKTGFKAWNKASERLDLHVGKVNSLHHKCFNKMLDLSNQSQSIQVAFDKQSEKQRNEHRIRLNVSINVVRFLLYFGLSFRGHDENDSSKNKGLFLGLLVWLAKRLPEVDRVILKHAPKNDMMTSPKIQKDVVSACAQETVKAIINDLDGDYFGILVDESKDITNGPFFAGYDGASNMQGKMNGLKALILQETPSAHCIHCFAHQLQLTLVAVVKKYKEVETFFAIVANVLNVIGASFKRIDQLRDHHAKLLEQLLESGEVQSGKGLNQERELQRPNQEANDRLQAEAFLSKINSFEFVFLLHLMLKVLLMSNELSKALYKKEQDIFNAMLFLDLTKERLQQMRDEG